MKLISEELTPPEIW